MRLSVREGGVFSVIVNGNLDRKIDHDQVEIKVVKIIVLPCVFSSHAREVKAYVSFGAVFLIYCLMLKITVIYV